MIILKIILGLFFILLILLILILIIPFSYQFKSKFYDLKMSGETTIKWGFGFIGVRYCWDKEKYYQLILLGYRLKERRVKAKNETAEAKKNTKNKKDIKKDKKQKTKKEREKITRKEVEMKELVNIANTFVKKLISILKPKYFRLYIRYGFDEPAIMGMMAGIIAIFTEQIHNANIYINTTFEEEVFEGEVELNGNLIVSRIIILILITIFKKPVRVLIFRKKKEISNLEEIA